MVSRRSVNLLILLIATVVLGGCGSIEERGEINDFTKASRDYGRMLRWRSYDGAAQFLRARDDSPIAVDVEPLKDIRVTSYRIISSEVRPKENEASVTAVIDYYNELQNRVKTLTDQQDWWYDPVGEAWFLDGNLPDFLGENS